MAPISAVLSPVTSAVATALSCPCGQPAQRVQIPYQLRLDQRLAPPIIITPCCRYRPNRTALIISTLLVARQTEVYLPTDLDHRPITAAITTIYTIYTPHHRPIILTRSIINIKRAVITIATITCSCHTSIRPTPTPAGINQATSKR